MQKKKFLLTYFWPRDRFDRGHSINFRIIDVSPFKLIFILFSMFFRSFCLFSTFFPFQHVFSFSSLFFVFIINFLFLKASQGVSRHLKMSQGVSKRFTETHWDSYIHISWSRTSKGFWILFVEEIEAKCVLKLISRIFSLISNEL